MIGFGPGKRPVGTVRVTVKTPPAATGAAGTKGAPMPPMVRATAGPGCTNPAPVMVTGVPITPAVGAMVIPPIG
ncbi:MAG: hypothetical protein DDT32_01832 [Syntrophomonadaceae bacterium]|nr:hypothetical protein [Bacillota bacterium]